MMQKASFSRLCIVDPSDIRILTGVLLYSSVFSVHRAAYHPGNGHNKLSFLQIPTGNNSDKGG